jgi:hypothetical protein
MPDEHDKPAEAPKATPQLPTPYQEHYLGDGLYVCFDGHSVWLRAPRGNGDHRVALEPAVLAGFIQWTQPIRDAQKQQGGG